jgi:predicted Zn-dependent protease
VTSVWHLRAQGDASFKQGDYAGAVRAYEQILESYPTAVLIRYLKGVALAQANRVEEATEGRGEKNLLPAVQRSRSVVPEPVTA